MEKKTMEGQRNPIIIPGHSYNLFFGNGNLNNKKIHIRAVIDKDQYVFRFWSKYKQRWIYEIRHRYFFELLNRDGKIKER